MDLLGSLLNNIDEALIVTDKHAKIVFFNDVALRMSKELHEEPLREGDDLFKVVSRVGKERVHDIVHEIQVKKQSDKSFAEYINRQGTTAYLESSYVPIINDEGILTYIHVFIRDITPQKIFEKKLTTQAANISHLIEKANAIIIGVDTRGYITDWNEYCTKITGFDKDEVFAQKFADVLLTKQEKYFDELLVKVMMGESVSNYEIPILTKSNQRAIFLLNCTPRTTPTNDVTGVLFVGQDVTELTEYRRSLEKKVEERTQELKQALEKEKEVVELKSRFISIASHEFRTPLSSIEFEANFIKSHRHAGKDEFNGKLETIKKQVKHMMYLLDDVLTYSKNEAGKIQAVISNIGLNDFLDFLNKITEDIGHSTKNTHIIKKDFNSLPKEIATDEKLLRNVLINLITNAIKFSPGQRFVYLGVTLDQNQLVISVCDKGMGIPEDEIDKVFEPFIRGSGVTSIEGTGLGLSIVKKAVELLSGSIQAESQIGKGTTFTVRIPMNRKI